nr:InlB B-repeat-containing protein [Caldilineaceae bacterium]
MRQRSFATPVLTAMMLVLIWLISTPAEVSAGIYNASSEITYKEYWAPHSEYTGGRADAIGCVDTAPGGYSWYIEPVKASTSLDCIKTVRINLPDNFSAALKAELYLDLWRAHTTFSAQYRINGGDWRSAPVGQEWSRTPYLVDLPLSDLVTGLNVFQFREVGGQYHVHDIGIRIYFDESHPLLNSQGQAYQAPQGELVSVWADNGLFPAASGGSLTVNDDQLVLTAHLATPAKYIEFHGYYRGYDLDVNDSDNDKGALDTEWQNRARNNFQVGGLAPLDTGGTQDHIGTVETPTPGDYSIYWPIPTVINQSGVLFKIRIVDANGVVCEAAGGVSAPFTLTRSGNQATHWAPNFVDIGLYMGGNKPTSVSRTLNLSSIPANYQEAYLIGSYWENPNISINNVVTFTAFTTATDKWALSVRSFNPTVLAAGANTIRYTHVSGFGEFVEKPGPLILLKQTTKAADTTPPNVTGRTPGPGATNVAQNAPLVVSVADAGRGVNFDTLKLKIDGAPVTFVRTGTPDEYTLTYTPESGWRPGSTVAVSVDACDFAGRCMNTATHSFTAQEGAYTLTINKVGNGNVAVEPLQPTYQYGDVVTLTATPDSGWQFSDWNTLATNWWDARWDYRAPITVAANGYARKNRPVELNVNFTSLLSSLGQSSALNPQSIRVVEVNSAGVVIDDHVQFQFDRASDYNASTKAAGTLIFLVKGDLPADGQRYYHLYFDTISKVFAAANVGDAVVLSSGLDEYWGSYLIKSDNATYAYHLQGGGFSSMVDVNGNDWLDYHDNPPDERGAYRGLPNMVPPPDGLFHPGKQNHLTTRLYSGPLKETFRTKTIDDKWEVQWEIYPTYASMTVLKRPSNKNYWWLYEGPPGGVVEDTVPLAQRDFVTLSNGASFPINQSFSGDLVGDEWGFISDPDVDNAATVARSIFLIHHSDDTAVDSFHTQVTGGAQTTKRMPIWGFGRNGSTTQTYLSATPNRFSVGFMDETAYAPGAAVINGVYRDLLVSLGNAATRSAITHLGDTTTITVTITGDTVISAAFAPAGRVYTLDTSVNGSGSVSKDLAPAAYLPGQVVTLLPPPASGWSFSSWSGNLTGSTNPATIAMNGNRAVTANFVQAQYAVTLNSVGSGAVTKTPNQATYTHGTQVTLSATPSNGWLFTGWSGDYVGTSNPVSIDVNSNLLITANFAPSQLTLNTVVVGSGTVTKNPSQATYAYGSMVTLTANPATGWVFAGWSGDVVD